MLTVVVRPEAGPSMKVMIWEVTGLRSSDRPAEPAMRHVKVTFAYCISIIPLAQSRAIRQLLLAAGRSHCLYIARFQREAYHG